MPATEMLGRRWSFATDDVPLLGFFPTLFHGLWALVLVIMWIVFGKHHDCYDGTTYTVVLAGLLTTFTMFTIVGCWGIYEGLKGKFVTLHDLPQSDRISSHLASIHVMLLAVLVAGCSLVLH